MAAICGKVPMLDPPYKKKIDVLAYLLREGWQVSKTALYDACADGFLRLDKRSGLYEKAAIDRYAKKKLRRQETGQKLDEEREERSKRRDLADTRKAEAQAAKAEHELALLEGKFILRADLDLELASRAVVFDSGLRSMIQSQSSSWIELVGGDQAKIPDLIEAMGAASAALLSDYATTARFQVVFKGNEEIGE